MSGSSPQYLAEVDIAPSVFVAISGDDKIKPASSTDVCIGVMHESTWYAPIPGMNSTVAVTAGHTKRVYGEDEICEVVIGVADLTAGDLIKADANGLAIIAASGAFYAVVLNGGLAGDRAKIVVTKGVV